jgi:hypothetical protein
VRDGRERRWSAAAASSRRRPGERRSRLQAEDDEQNWRIVLRTEEPERYDSISSCLLQYSKLILILQDPQLTDDYTHTQSHDWNWTHT